ncbi:hypothetical protein F5884DRAFT_482302 [Xylogone sp. PMI_703]|nr:hypothetical protein F5884DRAFT_482302 [Xylogone sp. PMI_703]
MASAKAAVDPSYAVYRSSDTGPSSSQVPLQDEDDRPITPPPYSGPTSPIMAAPAASREQKVYPGLPRLDYSLYSPKDFTLSSDQTTLRTSAVRLSTYPAALVSIIQALATVPPKPQIRIKSGVSSDGTPDFDIKLNLMNLIVPDTESKNRMNYVKIIGNREKGFRGDIKEALVPVVAGGLEEWARKYCEDPSSIKQFTLERVVTNWDSSYLEGRILSLIASTSYRGAVTITFPTTHNKVIIRPPDKVNRFFSNVTSLFTGTKRYEVVKAVWPYATVPRGEEGRRCAVQSEDEWFADWKDAIKHAIINRRKGWVTVEDRLEFLMEPKPQEAAKQAQW